MKMILPYIIALLAFSLSIAVGQDEQAPDWTRDFHDPRHLGSIYTWLEDGTKREDIRAMDQSILIVCWMPDTSKGDVATYQISGIEGRHSAEHAQRFLEEYYALEQSNEDGEETSNVIIVGTNWGAGAHLVDKLKELSEKHSFSVFYAGGRPFRSFHLIEEPESRLILIREAHKNATKSEQDGADQPAAAPESKPEGNEKPKAESEGRSQ